MTRAALLCVLTGIAACGSPAARPPGPARPVSVLLITIDTLRADRVGSYGATEARTPALDRLAAEGVRVEHAWASAPVTLPSHASILSGLYPPSHRSRHNGIAVLDSVPTLATVLKARGLATAAFVSAFPLDRRFGLARGFDVYDDEMPRPEGGAPLNERAGPATVERATAWLASHGAQPFFLWVHLFEPHAPYGDPSAGGSPRARYAAEVATADQQVERLLRALGPVDAQTLVVATSDHGEAFGEHGEIGHSVFVYDTTLRVPLLFRGPGIPAGLAIKGDVSLVDVAPTIIDVVGGVLHADGRSLVPAFTSGRADSRTIYAESFAPLLDFGWASLRSIRADGWKFIAAPAPELFDLQRDPAETQNVIADQAPRGAGMAALVSRWSGPELSAPAQVSTDAARRLQSLGYLQGSPSSAGAGRRADPKDRVAVASRIAEVTSGEIHGAALIAALDAILRDDPRNPQAHLRLGYAHIAEGQCLKAEPHLRAAMDAGVPSADAGLGLAICRSQAGDGAGARRALIAARASEPGNPVVAANLGLLALEENRLDEATRELRVALDRDPLLHEARFALARALARAGNRAGATAEAQVLLELLAPSAPQRPEVERFLRALR